MFSRRQLPNGSLSIENMSGALAGQYQCVATVDGIGTILSRQATVFLAGEYNLHMYFLCILRGQTSVCILNLLESLGLWTPLTPFTW